MIFTVNKSPFRDTSLDSCMNTADETTPILLYEDAVYAVAAGTKLSGVVSEKAKTLKFYALDADIKARGINNLIDDVTVIDYDGFVDLVEEHTVCPWN